MESVRRRLISATVVMVTGAIAAFPFYRIAPILDSKPNSHPTPGPTESPAGSIALKISSGEPSTATWSQNAPNLPNEPASEPNSTRMEKDQSVTVLKLPNRLPAAQETVPPAVPIRRPALDPLPAADRPLPASPETNNSQPRMHRIVDGDSLEELASRFLGDRSRWREIQEANRDILTTEDVLPIGKSLRIPPRDRGSSPPATEPDGLVPIPWQVK